MLKDKEPIKCLNITYGSEFDDSRKVILLKIKHTLEEGLLVWKALDFGYDSGYGGQELFGIVWLVDGTWLERGEYDGTEWWEHKECPEIPEELNDEI